MAFSCKLCGICPSSGTRRMAETAADLVDSVIPRLPVCQWALSFPIPLHSPFAVYPELLAPVLQIIHRHRNLFPLTITPGGSIAAVYIRPPRLLDYDFVPEGASGKNVKLNQSVNDDLLRPNLVEGAGCEQKPFN